MSGRNRERNRQRRRRAFHIAIALVLVICVMAPYIESAVDLNDSIFATGYDNESTVAILVLLLELVIWLAGVLVCVSANTESGERIPVEYSSAASESGFRISIPELSPPPPLRI